jgi:hypothetical protein
MENFTTKAFFNVKDLNDWMNDNQNWIPYLMTSHDSQVMVIFKKIYDVNPDIENEAPME